MGLDVKELLIGIPVLVFSLWIFAAPLPQVRIERGCQPINWIGNMATSTTALATDGHTETAVRWNDKLTYSCQYMIWRLFYQEAYNQAIKDGRVIAVTGAVATAALPAASAASAPAGVTPPAVEAVGVPPAPIDPVTLPVATPTNTVVKK